MSPVFRFAVIALGLALAGCETDGVNTRRIIVDTSDGQSLPQATITNGASQANISRSITVQSGKQTKVGFVVYTNPDCSNIGYATVRETISPANGTLDIKQTEDYAFFPEKNPRSACNKQRLKGVIVFYKSSPGFAGIDTINYEIFGPNGGLRRITLTVNVLL